MSEIRNLKVLLLIVSIVINWVQIERKVMLRTPTSIAFLIPAHNEMSSIRKTALSALNQSACSLPDTKVHVYVIADNCQDRTGEVVLETIQQLRAIEKLPNVFLCKTTGNTGRKAGALNHGYRLIQSLGIQYQYFISVDADTVLDPKFLENGLAALEDGDGGICGRIYLLPFDKKPFLITPPPFRGNFFSLAMWILLHVWKAITWALHTFWEYLWWSYQNIQYALCQTEIIGRRGKAYCLAGPGTLFKSSVLKEIFEKYGEVWPTHSIVEDFALTKRIQMHNYKTKVGHDMFTYTDCPIGFRQHRLQQERWNGGNLREFLDIGFNRHTTFESIDLGLQLLWYVCRITLIMTALNIVRTGFVYIDNATLWFLIVPLVITTIMNVVRFPYIPYKSLLQFLLLVCFGYELYALWYGVILVKSFYRAFTRTFRYWS